MRELEREKIEIEDERKRVMAMWKVMRGKGLRVRNLCKGLFGPYAKNLRYGCNICISVRFGSV